MYGLFPSLLAICRVRPPLCGVTKRISPARLALLGLSLLLVLLGGEGLYRWMLFGGSAKFASLRQPGQYADFFSDDDYWKLYWRFGGRYAPPGKPHRALGWVHRFDRETYLHERAGDVGEHRPVLLYGDSFATCVETELCFEELLEGDPRFASGHRLLNYGVGGYGVDQIMMLYEGSVHHFEDPFVVVMLMPLDLDRSALSVRVGQKPYFELEGETLELRGVPVLAQAADYFEGHPPEIQSYLFRKVLFSSFMPASVRDWVRGKEETIRQKKALNEALINRIVDDLQRRSLDFVFVVFHPHWPGVTALDAESDWRDPFLRELLDGRGVPYIWSKDLFREDLAGRSPRFEEWVVAANGHPTTRFNRLVADAIQARVLRAKGDL
jgi:hypothetical protein